MLVNSVYLTKAINGHQAHLFKSSTLSNKRNIGSFIRSVFGMETPTSNDIPTEENRFHPWETSPSPDLRMRAATIKARAKCPVTQKDINYTCPISGIPTHHDEESWKNDVDYHNSDRPQLLKKVNLFEHDIRSGRPFPEFDFPAEQERDCMVNLANWDTYLYTRQFYSMDTEFQLANVTKMLSFPMTINSILHEYSPYFLKPKGPMTLEGLKSLAALRYTLYPENRSSSLKDRPMRIFMLNAGPESYLPPHVWKELNYMFPNVTFELHFIGNECLYDREKQQFVYSERPVVKRIDDTLCLIYHTQDFTVLHEAGDFFPYDPYLDIFFCFHPRFTSPQLIENWTKSLPGLLESKCAIFITDYHETDLNKDWNWVLENFEEDLDILMDKTDNLYGSMKWELNDLNPQELFQYNQKVFGIRGKRYHAIHQGDSE